MYAMPAAVAVAVPDAAAMAVPMAGAHADGRTHELVNSKL
jgi:hypothetical protein